MYTVVEKKKKVDLISSLFPRCCHPFVKCRLVSNGVYSASRLTLAPEFVKNASARKKKKNVAPWIRLAFQSLLYYYYFFLVFFFFDPFRTTYVRNAQYSALHNSFFFFIYFPFCFLSYLHKHKHIGIKKKKN